jgi:membrane protease YdiL (CAAX protease family)
MHTVAPGASVYWAAIVLAALIFGILHLPAVAQTTALTKVVVLRTVMLNALAGIAFGWLFWRRGLEQAMVSHFSADLVLHVAAPMFP